MSKHVFLPVILSAFLMAKGAVQWEAGGFKTPESVVVNPATGDIFVSNINGPPTAKDDNGFISRLSLDGMTKNHAFIDGGGNPYTLNAPKGMAIYKGLLYVTDITHVRSFSLENGAHIADIDLTSMGASFLNDIAADQEGNLYVSDTASNTIFLIDAGAGNEARVFLRHGGLQGPNGLMVHPQTGHLIVASWGSGMLLEVTPDEVRQIDAKGSFKNLDGIDYDENGDIYFSDFSAGVVYKLESDGKVTPLYKNLRSPADIFVDRESGRILIPEFAGNTVKSRPLRKLPLLEK